MDSYSRRDEPGPHGAKLRETVRLVAALNLGIRGGIRGGAGDRLISLFAEASISWRHGR